MFLGFIAEPSIPRYCPHDARHSTDQEYPSPAYGVHQWQYDDRRQASGEMRGGEEDPLNFASLQAWNPTRKSPTDARPSSRFTRSKEKANDQQRCEIPTYSREHRKGRPPRYDPRKYKPSPNSIRPTSRRNLERGVGDRKRAEDPTHLVFIKSKIAPNVRLQSRQARAVEIRDRRKRQHKADNAIANACCGSLYHGMVLLGKNILRGLICLASGLVAPPLTLACASVSAMCCAEFAGVAAEVVGRPFQAGGTSSKAVKIVRVGFMFLMLFREFIVPARTLNRVRTCQRMGRQLGRCKSRRS